MTSRVFKYSASDASASNGLRSKRAYLDRQQQFGPRDLERYRLTTDVKDKLTERNLLLTARRGLGDEAALDVF